MKHGLRLASILATLVCVDLHAESSWAQSISPPAAAATGVLNRDSKIGDAAAPGGMSLTPDSLDGNPLWFVPLEGLSATRERPIFSATRRPAAAASMPLTTAVRVPERLGEPERLQLALIGTIVGTREGFGVFVDDTTKSVVRLRAGDDYHGWVLRAVRGRDATLEKGDQTQTLSLPRLTAEPPKATSRRRE
jgi:hypothetical protein